MQKEGRPELVCKFCIPDRVKPFASIVGLWGHLVHKHQGVGDQERLEEVQRTAALWREYWHYYSDGGKRGNPTWAKLEQTRQDGFTWNDVLCWELR